MSQAGSDLGDDDTLAAGETDDAMRRRVRASLFGEKEALRIGRFVVLRVLGEGGMGRVYAAYDERLDRRIAVKVLHHDMGTLSRQRIEREAKSMAKLSHPNVVQVYEVGDDAGQLFIAMEFVQGETLGDWQRLPDRTWREILGAYMQAGEALVAAHAVGVVHRDFKPHNTMVETLATGQPRVRVLDFGLARVDEGAASVDDAGAPSATSGDDPVLTATGNMLGTPAYMAPEQFTSSRVDAAADQFSFCVALWEGLYGERPFQADTIPALVRVVTSGERQPPPRDSPVPGKVLAALARGLSVDPAERWPSVRHLLDALAPAASVRTRPWRWAAAAVVAIGGLVVGTQTWISARAEPCRGAEAQLQGIWDSARRAEAEQAFVATGLPVAEQTWTRTEESLGAYAEQWVQMHTEACRATAVRGEQSAEVMELRMTCLRRAKTKLEAATGVFIDADADVVQQAHQVVDSLPAVDDCADIEALQSGLPPPPPELETAVADVRSLVAKTRAEYEAMRNDRAKELIEQAEAALANVDYAPLQAEVAHEHAFVQERLGDARAAEALHRRAILHAARWNQTEILHRAVLQVIYVVGRVQGRPAEVDHLTELALGLSSGLPTEARAWTHSTLGELRAAQGRFDEATTEHRRAIELWGSLDEAGQARLGMAHEQLAMVFLDRGELDAALVHARKAEEVLVALLGSEHPSVGRAHVFIAGLLQHAGAFEDMEREARMAIEIYEKSVGPDHPAAHRAHGALGAALQGQRRYAAATHELELALAGLTAAVGPGHASTIGPQLRLADALLEAGRYGDAEARAREALALATRLGLEGNALLECHHSLARVLRARKRHADAEEQLRRAVDVVARSRAPDHYFVGMIRVDLADVLLAQGKAAEAEAELRVALTALGDGGPAHVVAAARSLLALALVEQGRPTAARDLAEEAWASFGKLDVPAETRAEAAFVVARVLWASSTDAAERRRAIELAEEAVGARADPTPRHGVFIAEVDAWLAERR